MTSLLFREISQFKTSLALYMRLLPYVGAERRLLALTILSMLGATVLTLCQPWPMQVIVDSVLGGARPPEWIGVFSGEQSTVAILAIAVTLMIAALVLRQLTAMGQGYFSQLFGQRMVFTLRCDLYAKLQRLTLRFHDHNTVGDLMYRITEDAPALQDVVIYGFVPLTIELITAVAIVGASFLLDVRLGFAAVAIVPLLIVWTIWFSERVRHLSRSLASAESSLCASVNETLGSIRAVKSFAVEDLELERFQTRARLSQDAYIRVVTLSSAGGLVTEAIAGIGSAAVVFLGALAVLNGDLTVGQLLVFLAYVHSLYGPITQLAGSALVIQRSSASIERVLEIFDQEDEHTNGGSLKLGQVTGHLVYEDVKFGYDSNRLVIRDVSFEVRPEETVAFVGPSGTGKTTLLSLLLRFYQSRSGRILLDGIDITTLDLQWLRRQISLVLQDPIIFSCSLRENIAYGRPRASQAEIMAASQAAGLHDFIMELPDRYDSCVGERGVRLSGGQRQRLSIARAFLKDAPILMLDEPTSNLDATTEQHIFQAIRRLARGRTTLFIAHRLATAKRADRIVVLDAGRIVEQGTHAELLSAGGVYAQLCRDQGLGPPIRDLVGAEG
jgi:ABC-type multidrug transport system fused ATPase/permease subunit